MKLDDCWWNSNQLIRSGWSGAAVGRADAGPTNAEKIWSGCSESSSKGLITCQRKRRLCRNEWLWIPGLSGGERRREREKLPRLSRSPGEGSHVTCTWLSNKRPLFLYVRVSISSFTTRTKRCITPVAVIITYMIHEGSYLPRTCLWQGLVSA